MGCACKKGKGGTFKVKLPGGLEVSKSSESAALAFAAKHPGAKVIKPAA
jgi:hypothetical protein